MRNNPNSKRLCRWPGWSWLLGVIMLAVLVACRHGGAGLEQKDAKAKPSAAGASIQTNQPPSKTPSASGKKKLAGPAPKAAKTTTAAKKTTVAKAGEKPAAAGAPAQTSSAASTPAATTATPDGDSGGSLLGGNVGVSVEHDEEIRRIMSLARSDKWEEAEDRAAALYAIDPKDPAVQRIYSYVKTEGPKRREKALEDKIRDVTSRDSRFNPTLGSLLTDRKSRGLPPRSDLREAIEKIKARPYIPETFGKTIQAKGLMEDIDVSKGKMAAILDKQIEVHLDNVTLENIIFNIGQAEGINFIADKSIPAFQQKLSVNLKNVRLGELLNYVSRNLAVQFQVGGDLIWIVDGKDTNKVQTETRFYRLRKGFIRPAQFGVSDSTKTTVVANNVSTETDVQKFENFVRDGAPDQTALESAIRIFCKGVKFQIDYERNIVVARGTVPQLDTLESIIKELDKPLQQVLIEARFITVSEPTFLQLGVAWETGRDPKTSGRSATDYTGLGEDVGMGYEQTWYGVLGRTSLSATLTAIDQSGESEMLSAPSVTLVNNLPATISDGKIQYYYEEYSVTQQILEERSMSTLVPTGKPTQVTSGVTLDVLASVGGDGKSIFLALRPKVTQDVKLVTFATVTDRDDSGVVTSTFDLKLPEKREQTLATRVVVKSGQTVVLGGVSSREQRTFVESTPILGNIPIIGAAFRRRTEIDNPRFLLVFVTATLISENGEFIVSADAQ